MTENVSPPSPPDLSARSSRQINLIFECVQATIALAIVLAGAYLALTGGTMPSALHDLALIVIGFYFGKRNGTH